MGYHGIHFLGIAIIAASFAMGQSTNATYAGASTQGLAYVPNAAIAMVELNSCNSWNCASPWPSRR